jgi:hypothetical protein
MTRIAALKCERVQYIPSDLADGTIYVSTEFSTAMHKCCCGCGSKVVTPLSPTDWQATFDGELVSLYPSIGNWSFPCQSHYWIRRSKVVWAARMSQAEIDHGRALDRIAKEKYFTAQKPTGWRAFVNWILSKFR